MSLSPEEIVERRRLRRRVLFWRIFSFLSVGALIVSLGLSSGALERFTEREVDHLAQVRIGGYIVNDQSTIDLINDIESDPSAKGLLLIVDSPGGTTVGGEAIYEAIRSLASSKPVAVHVEGRALSAGYMIASAGDHIVARRSSMVGSVGVFISYADASGLLEKIGIRENRVKSGSLKGEPDYLSPPSVEVIGMLEGVVNDSHRWFLDLVAERRGLSEADLLEVSRGGYFTGTQGLSKGLIDEIGGRQAARDWMIRERGLSPDLALVEWSPVEDYYGWFESDALGSSLLRSLGLSGEPNGALVLLERLEQWMSLSALTSVARVEAPVTREVRGHD